MPKVRAHRSVFRQIKAQSVKSASSPPMPPLNRNCPLAALGHSPSQGGHGRDGNRDGTETGTQLTDGNGDAASIDGGHRSVGTLLSHAKSSAKSTRRAGVPCAEPIGRQEAPLRQGRRLRGVPAGLDRGAPAAPDPHPVLLRLVQPLALRRLAGRRRLGDGLLPLAGTHAMRWRVAHRTVGYGHLYQGRFKSFPVQSEEHLLIVLRYIERNVVGPGWPRGRSTSAGAVCGRGCMEKMRSRPSYRLGQWNAPWIGPIA